MARVLVVEDERDIQDLLKIQLSREGHTVITASSGPEAQQFFSEEFDLILLDWMLPGVSGIDLLKELRQQNSQSAVLMLTAKSSDGDIIEGLEAGADDYLTKPFDLNVLKARIKALLRRGERGKLGLGSVVINEQEHSASLHGELLPLTPYEYKLLITLAQNKGKVLTRDQLISRVQGNDISVVERAVDTHIFGLRKKLGEFGEMIETVRGVGYRIRYIE